MNDGLFDLIIIISGSAFDCISTYIIARKFEGREQNPFLRILMKRFGLRAVVLWLPLETSMVYLLLQVGMMISETVTIFRILIIFAPWIAGIMNISQFILLSRRDS